MNTTHPLNNRAKAMQLAGKNLKAKYDDAPILSNEISSAAAQMANDKLGKQYAANGLQPSDYCYNRINSDASSFVHPLFEQCQDGFKYLGPNFPYTGPIFWKPKSDNERQVGEWRNGACDLWHDPRKKTATTITVRRKSKHERTPNNQPLAMRDPLQGFDWQSLYARYDEAACGPKGREYDSNSFHLARFGSQRPSSDRELYYKLIELCSPSGRVADPVGTYQAILYWKLRSSQPQSQNTLWMMNDANLRQPAECRLLDLFGAPPIVSVRNVDRVVEAVELLDRYELPGMKDTCAIPMRTTFLHFICPAVVPVFDVKVLRAVGVNEVNANHSYAVLQDYLPFAWELADRYAAQALAVCDRGETPIRLVDMALWVEGELG